MAPKGRARKATHVRLIAMMIIQLVPVNVFREQAKQFFGKIPGPAAIYPVTSVPTFSPVTTRRRVPGLFMSNTTMGRSFSMQSVKAVMSITFNFLLIHSWKVMVLYLVAAGSFAGSAV